MGCHCWCSMVACCPYSELLWPVFVRGVEGQFACADGFDWEHSKGKWRRVVGSARLEVFFFIAVILDTYLSQFGFLFFLVNLWPFWRFRTFRQYTSREWYRMWAGGYNRVFPRLCSTVEQHSLSPYVHFSIRKLYSRLRSFSLLRLALNSQGWYQFLSLSQMWSPSSAVFLW